jgi:large repetitive protein
MAIVVTISPAVLYDYLFGSFYAAQVSATGGVEPYTFSDNGTLPPELSIDSVTGMITGQFLEYGSFDVVITVTDSSINVTPGTIPRAG